MPFASFQNAGGRARDLTSLDTCLALDASQLAHCRAFVAQARVIADRHRFAMKALQSALPSSAPAFPDQIAFRLSVLRAKTDALAELRRVARELYAVLTPRQQRQADCVLSRIFWEITQPDPGFQIAEPFTAREMALDHQTTSRLAH